MKGHSIPRFDTSGNSESILTFFLEEVFPKEATRSISLKRSFERDLQVLKSKNIEIRNKESDFQKSLRKQGNITTKSAIPIFFFFCFVLFCFVCFSSHKFKPMTEKEKGIYEPKARMLSKKMKALKVIPDDYTPTHLYLVSSFLSLYLVIVSLISR